MGSSSRIGACTLCALLLLAASDCSQLKFLKSASVPTAKGQSELVRGPAFDSSIAPRADSRADWPFYNHSLTGQRYSPLRGITTANVVGLRRVCDADLGEQANLQTGPVTAAGTIYLTTAQRTYAFDAATCQPRWRHSYRYSPTPDFDLKVNRGAALAGGRLYRGTNDGRVLALDIRTGRELWNVVAANPRRGETFPAAPIVWKDLVLIGNAGGDNFGVTGRMMAFDTTDGGRRWSTALVPQSGPAAQSWPAHTEIIPKTGGATWTSYAIDSVAGLLLVGTGNAGPDFLLDARDGANLHTTSIVAIDLRDGTIRWSRQLVERDAHDWDLSAAPSIIETRSGKDLIIEAGKDGYLHALDRRSGTPVYKAEVATHLNVDTPLGGSATRFCPGVNGGVEWNGPAFARTANLLVVGSIDWCTTIRIAPPSKLKGKTALPWTGSSELRHPFGVQDTSRSGWLTAVDAESGAIRWRFRSPTPMIAGVTATAGGLIFTGDLTGRLLAFDAADGRIVWQDSTALPIGGGVITYETGGRQFVAVAAGMQASTWQLKSSSSRLIIYALP